MARGPDHEQSAKQEDGRAEEQEDLPHKPEDDRSTWRGASPAVIWGRWGFLEGSPTWPALTYSKHDPVDDSCRTVSVPAIGS